MHQKKRTRYYKGWAVRDLLRKITFNAWRVRINRWRDHCMQAVRTAGVKDQGQEEVKEAGASEASGVRRWGHTHAKRMDWEGVSKMTGIHIKVQVLRDMMVAWICEIMEDMEEEEDSRCTLVGDWLALRMNLTWRIRQRARARIPGIWAWADEWLVVPRKRWWEKGVLWEGRWTQALCKPGCPWDTEAEMLNGQRNIAIC